MKRKTKTVTTADIGPVPMVFDARLLTPSTRRELYDDYYHSYFACFSENGLTCNRHFGAYGDVEIAKTPYIVLSSLGADVATTTVRDIILRNSGGPSPVAIDKIAEKMRTKFDVISRCNAHWLEKRRAKG